MRRILVTDQPLLLRVHPNVQPVIQDELCGLLGRREIKRVTSIIEKSGLTNTPPLKPAMALLRARGSISMLMPRAAGHS